MYDFLLETINGKNPGRHCALFGFFAFGGWRPGQGWERYTPPLGSWNSAACVLRAKGGYNSGRPGAAVRAGSGSGRICTVAKPRPHCGGPPKNKHPERKPGLTSGMMPEQRKDMSVYAVPDAGLFFFYEAYAGGDVLAFVVFLEGKFDAVANE